MEPSASSKFLRLLKGENVSKTFKGYIILLCMTHSPKIYKTSRKNFSLCAPYYPQNSCDQFLLFDYSKLHFFYLLNFEISLFRYSVIRYFIFPHFFFELPFLRALSFRFFFRSFCFRKLFFRSLVNNSIRPYVFAPKLLVISSFFIKIYFRSFVVFL